MRWCGHAQWRHAQRCLPVLGHTVTSTLWNHGGNCCRLFAAVLAAYQQAHVRTADLKPNLPCCKGAYSCGSTCCAGSSHQCQYRMSAGTAHDCVVERLSQRNDAFWRDAVQQAVHSVCIQRKFVSQWECRSAAIMRSLLMIVNKQFLCTPPSPVQIVISKSMVLLLAAVCSPGICIATDKQDCVLTIRILCVC
jgi:hypothetical protein